MKMNYQRWSRLGPAWILGLVAVAYWSGALDALAQAAGTAPAHTPKDETFWEMWQKGGVMMWVMLVVSIFAMSLIIENLVKMRIIKVVPPDIYNQVRTLVDQGNYQEAWRVCKSHSSTFARVIGAGLQRLGKGKEAVEIALEEHAMKEASMMKTKNNYLSVIGVVSPMLGLLGAVLGMLKAFKAIGEGTALSDPTKLAAAIGEVLVATAFGLFIAVPAFFAYYFFRNRAQAVVVALEDSVTSIMDRLPYAELQGIKIGDELESELAGTGVAATPAAVAAAAAAAPAAAAVAVPQVSCPNCNNPIAQGQSPCPSCGAQIQWS
jgi:biopolymer transport protein ExbB